MGSSIGRGAAVGAAGGGLLGGTLAATPLGNGLFKGQAGVDAGNPFAAVQGESEQALKDYLQRSPQAARAEMMEDPTLKQYFGGDLDSLRGRIGDIGAEERDLATRGFSLQPEDREAYGQSAGDLARMFGAQEQSLSSALANRGLSSSAAAGRSFAGLQGNKMERLAGLQRQIANDRMKSNMERLGQTRQFYNSLLGEQSGRMGQYTGELGRRDNFAGSKANLGQASLAGMAAQANENMSQRLATEQESPFMRFAKAGMPIAGGVIGSAFGGPQGGQIGAQTGGALGGAMGKQQRSA